MTVEQIENFLAKESIPQGKVIRFEMKKRNPVRGLIVQGRDYNELKTKNFGASSPKQTWLHIKNQTILTWQRSSVGRILQSFPW